MRWLLGSSVVACSYFEMASSRFDPLAWSPSLARFTASMLLRLQPTSDAANKATVAAIRIERIVSLSVGVERPGRGPSAEGSPRGAGGGYVSASPEVHSTKARTA